MNGIFITLIIIFACGFMYNLHGYGIAIRKEQASEKSNRFLERRVNRSLFLAIIHVNIIILLLMIWARI